MGLIRKKRGYSGAWRSHQDDARQALQLLGCGAVRIARLVVRQSAERFVEEGYAIQVGTVFALTGRGVIAALVSPSVWALIRERRRLRRQLADVWATTPRGWPIVPTPGELRNAGGRDIARYDDPEVLAIISEADRIVAEARPFASAAVAAGLRPQRGAMVADTRGRPPGGQSWLQRQGHEPTRITSSRSG